MKPSEYEPKAGEHVWFLFGYGHMKTAGLVAIVVHVHVDGSLNLHVLSDGEHAQWNEPSRLMRGVVRGRKRTDIGTWSATHPDHLP